MKNDPAASWPRREAVGVKRSHAGETTRRLQILSPGVAMAAQRDWTVDSARSLRMASAATIGTAQVDGENEGGVLDEQDGDGVA